MAAQKKFWVYIMTNRSKTLYTGVTSRLEARVREHKEKRYPGFTNEYQIDRLIYFEFHATAASAIAREKQIKGWVRRRKIELIVSGNPEWRDLSEEWGSQVGEMRLDPKLQQGF